MAMGPAIRQLPVEKAVTSPFRYKSLKIHFILFPLITSCETTGTPPLGEIFFIGLMTSDRILKASREGSK